MYTSTKGKIPARRGGDARDLQGVFHLVYDRGKGGSLTKVDVSK